MPILNSVTLFSIQTVSDVEDKKYNENFDCLIEIVMKELQELLISIDYVLMNTNQVITQRVRGF
ncbi:unnamed protein product [Paramecium octaurelia]|uniref:Uncharacterized protein n=1 Tax=Paramecium octaurelia TaxID=43137 RepID=A0A8S1VXP5_PAROT|nr:unnamed protein product [Paramecium octaurelia]